MADEKPKKELTNEPVVEIIPNKSGKSLGDLKDPKDEKKGYVSMKLSRKMLWISGAVLIILALGVMIWQFKWYQPLLNRYNKASVIVKVKEDDKFAIVGAKVTLNNNEYTTDDAGKISLSMVAGDYVVKVEKDGYTPLESPISVKRGDNEPFNLSIKKLAEKIYSVKGFVQDYVTAEPMQDVQVTLGSKSVNTNPAGEFAFEGLVPSETKLIVTKSGYINKEVPLSIVDADLLDNKVQIVPTGQLIFVSNRDGKRKLYVSNYDGGSQKALSGTEASGEDFAPFLSPDGKWVLFSSTRDGLKDNYGSEVSVFYLVGIDGKTLRKLGDNMNGYNVQWSSNSKYIYFESYNSVKLDKSTYSVYDLANQKILEVGDVVNSGSFSQSGDIFAYSTNVSETRVIATPTPSATPSPTPTPSPVASGSPVVTPTQTATPAPATQTVTVYQVKTFNVTNGERKILATRDQYISNLRFASSSDVLGFDTLVDGGKKRFEISVNGGDQKEVAVQPYATRNYVVQPKVGNTASSAQVFIEQRDGKNDLYLVDMSEKNEKKLTNLGVVSSSLPPTWDGGGKYVIFAVKREAESALYIVATSGKGEPKKVTDYFAEAGYRGY